MDFLSRAEEIVLLAVWRLGENAYCVPIRKVVAEVTGKEWSFGALYVPLGRLEKKGLLRSTLSGPTNKRGGRSKRYYKLTPAGARALREVRSLQEALWTGVPDVLLDETA
ncbi:MAG: PadR family transcriptional regulator [Candidatus Aminicenantes bacterium]|nr:PadR family transcriptional regulator [Candidatus Aminicenantes bacterium]